MPDANTSGRKAEYTVDKLDGGLNTRFSPSDIGPYDSPDCLNVVYDTQGSVATRDGSVTFNTQAIGSFVIDGLANYNGTMIAWAGGSMWRASGTTFVTVGSAQSVFVPGNKIAFALYQNLLFNSDGVVSYKYDGAGFFQAGVAIPGPVSSSGTSAGNIALGTYFYKVAYFNSQAVEGQLGTVSSATSLAASSHIGVTSIPVGATSAGVNGRYIYRSNSGAAGVFLRVGTINDNVTTTFDDNTGVGSEGTTGQTDGSPVGPYRTIALHKERLFYDDSTDRSLLRYTEYTNPFVSKALNFVRINTKSFRVITAIGIQQDVVTIFMDDDETWVLSLIDPSDATTWEGPLKSPVNYGIVGPRAFVNIPDGILFFGKRDGKITGVHIISGIELVQTADRLLHSDQVAKNIETLIKALPSTGWADIAMDSFNNQVFAGIRYGSDATNAHALWFDINRASDDGDPGSWSLWSGITPIVFVVYNGFFYYGTSTATGFVNKLFAGTYADRGVAIDSYWWSRMEGFGKQLQAWVKDFRKTQVWYSLLGAWPMRFKWRVDADLGVGNSVNLDLTPGGSLWGTMVWGVDPWGGGASDRDTTIALANSRGRRIQVGFDNQNIIGQAFKVHRYLIKGNLRGQR